MHYSSVKRFTFSSTHDFEDSKIKIDLTVLTLMNILKCYKSAQQQNLRKLVFNEYCNQTFIWVQENFMRLSRTSVSGIILTVNQSTFILPGNLFKILNIGLILRIITGNHFKLFYHFSLQNKDTVIIKPQ